MDVRFEKWQGTQNDFIVVRLPERDLEILLASLRRQALQLCHRHQGVGADGILVLWEKPTDPIPQRLSIINSDGSIAQNCGNGLRCATGSILRHEGVQPVDGKPRGITSAQRTSGRRSAQQGDLETLQLEVEGRPMICTLLGKSGSQWFIAVAMPPPLLNQDLTWWDTGKGELQKIINQAKPHLGPEGFVYEGAAVEVGNKHLVVSSDDMSREWVRTIGPKLQEVTLWDGINVHGIRAKPVTDRDRARAGQEVGGSLESLFDCWVWERGAGETLACGSGAVAVGVQHLATGMEERDHWIGVDMPGGRLYIKQTEEGGEPLLAGPAEFVFEGNLNL